MQEIWVQSLGQEDPLEKEMATHSSIFAWEIPWTEESHKTAGHNLETKQLQPMNVSRRNSALARGKFQT